jgi:MFS family permease
VGGAQEAQATSGPPAQTPVPLRRNAGFRWLWIGQVLSDTGTTAALIAYPLLVLALTHSPAIAGVVATARMAMQLVLGLPGGALADRLDRRLTMIACDCARVGLLALLGALVLLHWVAWPVVLAVALADGAANVLFDPSVAAAQVIIVADEQLERASAASEGRMFAAGLVGPALGGFLFGLGNSVPFLADAASYLISAVTLGRIRGRFRPERSGKPAALWRETAAGLHLVWREPLLRAIVIQAPLINFAFSGVIFTITVALRRGGTAPAVIGLAQAGIAAGGLIGALIAPRLTARLTMWQLNIALAVAGTAMLAVAAALIPSPLAVVPVAIPILLGPTANATLFAAKMRRTPAAMQGRVSSTINIAATALAALAPLIAGLLVQHVSSQWAMAAFAAAIGVSVITCLTLPGFRDAETSPEQGGEAG